MTWLFHSSVAAVILLTTFASRGLIHPELAVVMVLGVNLLLSSSPPILTRHAPPETRRPAGNLLMRGAGSLIMLVLTRPSSPPLASLAPDPVSQVVNAHILFNVLVMIAGIPLRGWSCAQPKRLQHLECRQGRARQTNGRRGI